MEKLPQRLVNVRAADRAALTETMTAAVLADAIDHEQAALAGRGRVLVRASGTEPLIRVMVEAPTRTGDRRCLQALGRRGQIGPRRPSRRLTIG